MSIEEYRKKKFFSCAGVKRFIDPESIFFNFSVASLNNKRKNKSQR
jgi:hypothetical protein